MKDNPEIERLAHVYEYYREDRSVHARWDVRNPGNRCILAERQEAIRALLHRHSFFPLSERRILDVGCGKGDVMAGLLELGAQPEHLWGVDLLAERVKEAQTRYPALQFRRVNAEQIGFQDEQFDLVLLFTVFSSINDCGMSQNVAKEVRRVLKSKGAVLWYDFRYDNPHNPHVHGMNLMRIQELFPGFGMHMKSITLLPFLARKLGPMTSRLYPVVAAIPFLRTHYLGLLVKLDPTC
jgi:ubiquinone/menaquinone biosynthesis C-methylase UbiE